MRHMTWAWLILIVAFAVLTGCGDSSETYPTMDAAESAGYAYGDGDDHGDMRMMQANTSASPMSPGREAAPTDPSLPIDLPSEQTERKIIYNADIDLVVDAFEGVPAQVAALAKAHGGFVAQSAIHGSAGEPRDGRWTLRIPSDRYEAVMQDAESIGQLRSVQSTSREVTAEFVDLQSRLRNKVAEETRLIEHLDQTTGDLKDILEVERELSRVRGEAEVLQGRLNMLADLTSMSTVVVRIEEIRDYTPAPTQEPGFGAQAGRAWAGSLGSIVDLGRALAIGVVAVVPWLVVIVPIAGVVVFVLRRLARRVLSRPAAQPATPS
ncbi:MAG: DUF4349 domain-containing protein [Phycisphaerales bacterium JB063]